MRFLHTGDLHLGKTVNDFSMIADQKYILEQITDMVKKEAAEALVIAGDVYDRAIPPAEAVTLLNDFLTQMVQLGVTVLMISGNHDSPERVSFAEEILKEKGVYIAGIYKDGLKKIPFFDEYGEVTFVLLPFIKPAVIGTRTNGEAVEKLLAAEEKKEGTRRVLVSHFFVTDCGREPELSDGETTIHVGGLDNVEASLFNGFDYVALGHIHKPQRIGERQIYYAGAPLAYSFSEAGRQKTVNLVEIKGEGDITVKQLPLTPLHEMRKIRGRMEELMADEVAEAADRFDYIQAQLANEEELIDPIGTLRSVYPNIMQIVLMKNESRGNPEYESKAAEKRKSIPELFAGFYQMVRNEEPDEERMEIILETAKETEGEQEI
ncbi:exodeoxyribonuclease I subunit D [Kineothrix alysoides]|uniref:Nuclease SbcCD subunit D n=1 Tax=Kineothrix alysoides TaxID=1469948 RepID=A0A4R1R540_9FIRM|nr:exonuclease SbcCD subunit D [Kineothrix alysoides]TCL60631.1 exodeoxyribonuclease I subunit D [Kineothrix alysoides]